MWVLNSSPLNNMSVLKSAPCFFSYCGSVIWLDYVKMVLPAVFLLIGIMLSILIIFCFYINFVIFKKIVKVCLEF